MGEVEATERKNAELLDALERERARNKQLEVEVQALQFRLDILIRRLFGKKSEKLDPNQLDFLKEHFDTQEESGDPPADGEPEPEKKRRKRSSPQPKIRTPEDLEVVDEVLIPAEVQANPDEWREIAQEILRRLDFQPGRFFLRRTIRPKYVHKTDRERAPLIQPAPPQLLDRGVAAPGLLAHVLVSKYCDHLPLYRQEDIFSRRHGVHIPRQQMAQWIGRLAGWVNPIYQAIRDELKSSKYVQGDETPIRMLDRKHPTGSALGYLWVYLNPRKTIVYDWGPSRSADALQKFLGPEYEGLLQCDGYSAYGRYEQDNEKVTLIGCWAHCRRKFEEAKAEDPTFARWILGQMQEMYQIDARLRKARAGPKLRAAHRAAYTAPIIRRLFRAFEIKRQTYLPASGLGKAIAYAFNQRRTLERVVDHGCVELDNNLVENSIRPTAIGKKNWLFVGDKDAGRRAAIFYTLIQNCRLQGIEPLTYLTDILERLPKETNQTVAQLTPAAWAKARSPRRA